jgi:hypothetical protein
MAPGRTSFATGIVALALAFHRAPVKHPDLLHGRTPLPAGLAVLLKLAGGSQPDPEFAALAGPDELRAAALFFVEQVLLHHDASHYRVLGLEPGASTEQIKEHHRLLMRVFHPDRERHDGDWKDAFATRINLAYTHLHEPAARRRYDATLQATPRQGTSTPVHRPAHHAKPPRLRGLPPRLRRYLPQWVLAGTAIFAVAVVGAIYLNNPRLPAARLARAPLPVQGPLPAGTPPPAAAARKPAPASEAPAKPVVAAAEAQQAPAPDPAQPIGRAAPPAVAEALAPSAQPARGAVIQVARPSVSPQPAPAAPTAQTAPPFARPAPAPVVAAAPQPAQLDPNATLERFMSTYERGDTPGFMALFDEVAIGNAGGKPQIRRDHEALFRSTDLRHIDIEEMAWAQEGDWLRGKGRYRTTLMRKGELQLQTEAGLIRIELLRRGDQALIMALDYQPGERS